jgi:prevent-host-death family protein
VKTVEMSEATASLGEYARKARRHSLVVTRRGKPIAALLPLPPGTDLENLTVSVDPRFVAMIERSRFRCPAGTGLSTAEVRQLLAARRRVEQKRRAG